jgi:hypothetical protein
MTNDLNHIAFPGSELIDPITLDVIRKPTFSFKLPNGSLILYNPESIAEYFLQVGSIVDPVTRVIWTKEDLERLQIALQEPYNGHLFENESLIFQIESKIQSNLYNSNRKQSLISIENCLGELIAELLGIIEGNSSVEISETNISLLLSQFEVPFEEMKAIDIEYSFQVWSSWLTFLNGPQRRPNVNRSNLLSTVIKILECKLFDRFLEIYTLRIQ